MKIARLPTFLGFIAITASAAAAGPVLWQNVSAGMSIDQVHQAQPSALVPAKKETLYGGASCELQIPKYEVGGMPFSVCFFFLNGGLKQVMMTTKNANRARFQTIAELLRTKYGTPLLPETAPCKVDGFWENCEINWLAPSGANVGVLFSDVPGSPTMNIYYQDRISRDAGKL